jgi:hypothetical protein
VREREREESYTELVDMFLDRKGDFEALQQRHQKAVQL